MPKLLSPMHVVLAAWLALGGTAAAAEGGAAHHALWELHGKHNTVYLLGSVHVLRASDYPLPAVVEQAYRSARTLTLEVDLQDAGEQLQSEMLASAMLRDGHTLEQVLGPGRYDKAQGLARSIGIDLKPFDGFAPWFAAEAIAQEQLQQLGFAAQSGIDLYFLEKARTDHKPVEGLETVHDQIAIFDDLPLEDQAAYLMSSLEEARDLPHEVDDMVRAWREGDTAWFEREMLTELGQDPRLYQSLLVTRNRRWVAHVEALLGDGADHLIIVGTAHLVGKDSLLALLARDGFSAVQR